MNLLQLQDGERVQATLPVRSFEEQGEHYVPERFLRAWGTKVDWSDPDRFRVLVALSDLDRSKWAGALALATKLLASRVDGWVLG